MNGCIHPGEVLLEEFLGPLGMSASRLAELTIVPETRIAAIIGGQEAVTPEMAIALGRTLGTTAEFWTNLQEHFDASRVTLFAPENAGEFRAIPKAGETQAETDLAEAAFQALLKNGKP